MIWQGFAAVFALWLGIRCIAGRRGRLVLILGGRDDLCVFLQIEVQLIQTLGFAPEPVPVLPVKLMLELLDLEAERLDLIDQKRADGAQLDGIFGQFVEVFQHAQSLPEYG